MYRRNINLLLLFLYSVCVYSANTPKPDTQNANDTKYIESESNTSDKVCDCGEHSTNCSYLPWDKKVCECEPGYSEKGDICAETCKGDRDCLPGQKCRKEGDGYFCGCPANYTGEECQTHELCVNLEPTCKRMGASCVVDPEPLCRCPPGKTVGLPSGICEDTCNPERCLHGKCLDIGRGFYSCECDKGYTGRHCEEKIEKGIAYQTQKLDLDISNAKNNIAVIGKTDPENAQNKSQYEIHVGNINLCKEHEFIADNRDLITGILAMLGVATAVSIVGNVYFICRNKTKKNSKRFREMNSEV